MVIAPMPPCSRYSSCASLPLCSAIFMLLFQRRCEMEKWRRGAATVSGRVNRFSFQGTWEVINMFGVKLTVLKEFTTEA